MMKRSVYLLILSALIATACGGEDATATPEPAAAGDEIQNIVWQWVKVTNQATGDTTTVSNPEDYTLIFRPDGTVEGQADCNDIGGTYTRNGGFTVTIETFTQAFCGEASLDQQYLELLSNVVAGGPDGSGGLALESAGGEQRMEFQDGGRDS